ncbi:ATP-binding protein [Aestuariibaculum sp. M13]|uniref:ATP-binding protein n=1 Tax=Aestuariibaculum sp. M13 TaxID=2967132 RepID=UPI00215A0160|nr:ATP-binding protein [Aestuariibaculum sp. M13]MCR8667085.1 ATP-binding protein [Aestuariibaculum sp. M13]
MNLKTAQREDVKLRIGISGASGTGKTYSALLLAYGITEDWTKIAVIDTENGSANLYSSLGNYNVLALNEPYSPERYIEAIKTCEKADMEVVIIDSVSQEWQGTGGCLQIHESLGGRFQDWALVTPRHQAFVDAILNATCHMITTVRSKIDYAMDVGSNGKTKVVKHGLKPITREGLDYELTLFFELINDKHMARTSKDRTGLFSDKPEFLIGKATGKKLVQWSNLNSLKELSSNEIKECTTLEGLKHIYNKYPALKEELYPLILNKKRELENQIITEDKIVKHGTDSKE